MLGVLVALSIGLLTAYFGESAGGGLHAVQRGAMEVFAPLQEGADRAIKPFRDLFRWFGDTAGAKDERDRLKVENGRLRAELARVETARRDAGQLAGLAQFSAEGDLERYEPVTARVFERSSSTWYSTMKINKGTSDGVAVEQPVVTGEGLVGKVTAVSDGNAVVTLLTDQDFGIAALAPRSGEHGSLYAAVGEPGELVLDLVEHSGRVRQGDRIVTSGTRSRRLPSLFPRAIPVGVVRRVDEGEGELDRRISVMPSADLGRLDIVDVLTRPRADLTASVAPSVAP